MVGLPPSASVADAEQVNVELVVTPELGVTVTLTITGSVFPTLTLALAKSVAPALSVATAVHLIESSGDAVEVLSFTEFETPRTAPESTFVHR